MGHPLSMNLRSRLLAAVDEGMAPAPRLAAWASSARWNAVFADALSSPQTQIAGLSTRNQGRPAAFIANRGMIAHSGQASAH